MKDEDFSIRAGMPSEFQGQQSGCCTWSVWGVCTGCGKSTEGKEDGMYAKYKHLDIPHCGTVLLALQSKPCVRGEKYWSAACACRVDFSRLWLDRWNFRRIIPAFFRYRWTIIRRN